MTKKNPQTPDPTGELDDGPSDTGAPEDLDPLAACQTERDGFEQRLLRVSADYQNYVRRSEQNLQNTHQQALIGMAKAMLTPLDHFEHALDVDPTTTTAEALLQGVQIVRDELVKALDQFGVQRLDVSPGDEFDPNRHEALVRQPAPGIEDGRIAAQLQPGYTLGQTTLRPAKVAIAQPSTPAPLSEVDDPMTEQDNV